MTKNAIEGSSMAQLPDISVLMKHHYSEFRPVAYYDKHLDCIRVQIADCSFTEKRLNKFFTILKQNHRDTDTFVGFNIKGVRYLFEKLNLQASGVIMLTDLIDQIVKLYPDQASRQIESIFRPMLSEESLQIDFAEAA